MGCASHSRHPLEKVKARAEENFMSEKSGQEARGYEVGACNCRSWTCPDCAWMYARDKAGLMADRFKRLGVKRLGTICLTLDSGRFESGEFAIDRCWDGTLIRDYMHDLWGRLPVEYRRRYTEPVYVVCREVHEGKRGEGKRGEGSAAGRGHAHIYFPALSGSGIVSRPLLDWIRDEGIKRFGRTTYGWSRQKEYSLPIDDAVGYASKVLGYAAKGSTEHPAWVESRGRQLITFSHPLTRDDPECVQRREGSAIRQAEMIASMPPALAEHDAWLRGGLLKAKGSGDRSGVRHWSGRLERWEGKLGLRPRAGRRAFKRRSYAEIRAGCGQAVRVLFGGEFVSGLSLSIGLVRTFLLDMAGGCSDDPDDSRQWVMPVVNGRRRFKLPVEAVHALYELDGKRCPVAPSSVPISSDQTPPIATAGRFVVIGGVSRGRLLGRAPAGGLTRSMTPRGDRECWRRGSGMGRVCGWGAWSLGRGGLRTAGLRCLSFEKQTGREVVGPGGCGRRPGPRPAAAGRTGRRPSPILVHRLVLFSRCGSGGRGPPG